MVPPIHAPVPKEPPSSFFPPVEAFNEQATIAFGLMIESTCKSSQERVRLEQRQQKIG